MLQKKQKFNASRRPNSSNLDASHQFRMNSTPSTHDNQGLDSEERLVGGIARLLDKSRRDDLLDLEFGYPRINDSAEDQIRLGWLINVHPTLLEDKESHTPHSCVDFYFLEQDGSTFKATVQLYPYFFLGIRANRVREVEGYLQRKFESLIYQIEPIQRVDLEMKNHLAGLTATYLRISFLTIQDLVACRMQLAPIVASVKAKRAMSDAYEAFEQEGEYGNDELLDAKDHSEYIEDIREYDIPYYQRVMIDTNIRVSMWYDVIVKGGRVELKERKDLQQRAQAKVLAFDIECTKAPLKFPDTKVDSIMMISYMIDGQGYLIINREHVGADIEDFEYTPKPEMKGPFIVWNEPNEVATLQRFVSHIKEERPNIFVTFNGDGFDWKFLEERSRILRIPLTRSIGLTFNKQDEYYSMRHACHLDAFHWVRRDSYLPQGSQGLKAVTRSKLGYDPLEIDPELMVDYALSKPLEMAQYSVSDAVATYYLYMKYVHPFIFSLCNILPMHPDDVLRKGTGTLCEALLMVEAHKVDVIFPNKKGSEFGKFYDGHLIAAETYVGGHVEALAAGIYRSDLPCDFVVHSKAIEQLKEEIDQVVKFFVEVECGASMNDLVNEHELKTQIRGELESIITDKKFFEEPKIYHVDVAAMYPNIILTYRLQPTSIVDDTVCSSCLFNQPESKCKRKLEWQWRVDYFPAKKAEFEQIKSQLELESFPVKQNDGTELIVSYLRLSPSEQQEKMMERLKMYCKSVYKKTHETETIKKIDTVCMRENPLYVDTVREFRDRRYVYRTKAKNWGKELDDAKKAGSAEKIQEATDMVVLYDSLQLAHKCILNSFYGYVMRKGARWYSMEMAAIVTNTGAEIIKRSRELIDKIGKPLELDTDGIWCCLPKSFPDTYNLILRTTEGGTRKASFNFLCSTLNARIHSEFSNHQYQTLVNQKTLEYSIRTECTIFFELDGPYKCMVLPTSTEEGKQLKKRYAVFGHDNKLHEFKGFELKRRGELKAVKDFQAQIFDTFLQGRTLVEAYDAASVVADYFLDILDAKGVQLRDEELLELLSESRSMSKGLEEYLDQKSTSITTAKRLTDFLGSDGKTSEKGLACRWILSKKPEGKPIAERAIPVQIFSASSSIQSRYIKKWCGDNSMTDVSLRSILDWDYYRQRLCSQFQKLITLPAYFQGVPNPLKRVPHPDWLAKRIRSQENGKKQLKISDMFQAKREIFGIPMEQDSNMYKIQEELNELKATDVEGDEVNDPGAIEVDIEDLGATPKHSVLKSKKIVSSNDEKDLSMNNAAMEVDEESEEEPANEPTSNAFGLLMKKGEMDAYQKSKEKQKKAQRKQAIAQFTAEQSKSGTTAVGKRKRPPSLTDAEDAQIEALGKCPNELDDQQGWLEWHKKLWRIQKARRKKRHREYGANTALLHNTGSNSSTSEQVNAFINRMNLALLQKPWNILQVVETERPGILRLFVTTNDTTIHKVLLKVDRRLYINSYSKLEDSVHHEAQSTLPRMRQKFHLYSWDLDERTYLDQHREIAAQRSDPNIEGFYESQVPLVFRAVMEIGCLCKVRSEHRGHDVNQPWELHQLEALQPTMEDKAKSTPTKGIAFKPAFNQYLAEPRPPFVYLYQAGPMNRLVFGIFNASSRKCYIILLSKPGQDNISLSNLKEDLKDPSLNVEAIREPTADRVLYAVSKILAELQRNPIIIFSQCSIPMRDLLGTIVGSVLRQSPVMQMAANRKDDEFSKDPLLWSMKAGKLFIQRTTNISKWYNSAIDLARYSRVPICNFETDFALYLSDVAYARRLKQNDCVMWYSDNLRPDLGGNEDDDTAFSTEITNPDKVYSDCVETVSIEFDITGLSVNTILQSNYIPDLENALLSMDTAGQHSSDPKSKIPGMNFDDNAHNRTHFDQNQTDSAYQGVLYKNTGSVLQSFDETSSCVRAFKVLKNLVTSWSVDTIAEDKRSGAADCLVSNFYRWVSSRHSKLYDPALHKLVHKLIKKVYIQLLAELKKLGARIIFSSFNKIIVATDKRTLREAQTYAFFLKDTFKRSRELFRYVDLMPKRFFDILLFKDVYNYVAIPFDLSKKKKESSEPKKEEETASLKMDSQIPTSITMDSLAPDSLTLENSFNVFMEIDLTDTQQLSLKNRTSDDEDVPLPHSVLHIADYLPLSVRRDLHYVVYGFVVDLLKSKRETIQRLLNQPGLLIAADAKKAGMHHTGGGSMLLDDQDSVGLMDIITEYHKEARASSFDSSFKSKPIESTHQELALEEQQNKIILQNTSDRMIEKLSNISSNMLELTDREAETDVKRQKLSLLVHPEFKFDNPALEFVNLASYLLSLKKSVQVEISSLKRNLLRSLNIREFSTESDFKDPVSSYSLPNVVCGYCNSFRDLDMLRDQRLLVNNWNCPVCNHPYDKFAIEERLVDIVHRRVSAFQTQDIHCLKCGDIQSANMNTICSTCSGQLAVKQNPCDFASKLMVFENISKYHQFKWLMDTVSFYLNKPVI